MARGGKRKGAGRKKGFSAIEAEETRAYIAHRLVEALEPITDVLIERAKSGDMKAIRELFDRALGRPPQSMSLEGSGKPVIFQIAREIAEKHGILSLVTELDPDVDELEQISAAR